MKTIDTVRAERSQQGVVLLAVLWVISLASLIAGGLFAATRTELYLTRHEIASLQARSIAEGAVYRAILALHEPRKSVSPGLPELPPIIRLAGHEVVVTIENEAGKIDLNTAAAELIQGLLEHGGLDPHVASAITEHWVAIRARSSAEPTTEDQALSRFASLLSEHIGVLQRIAASLTVDNGSDGINPRVASAATLLSVPGMGDAHVRLYLSRREHNRLESPMVRSVQSYFNDHLSPVYTIRAKARVGDVTEQTRARIRLSTDRQQPFQVLSWTEPFFGDDYEL